MIIGIGTDIVELSRLEQAIRRGGDAFLKRVYTANELEKGRSRLEYLGGRWAAKEAAAKALGCGIGSGCAFTDIDIATSPSGAPVLNCTAPAAKVLAEHHGGLRWHVSISHEHAYAVATVIVEEDSSL
jgi:holo-[acyl-carrier protein] synthase